MSGRAIRNLAEQRNIKYVFHFTRLSNLESILRDGLISRAALEFRDNRPEFNDQHRFDSERNATCCSIGHPNYKMFFSLRKQYAHEKWVVLVLGSNVLWEKECAFCMENAASNNVTSIAIGDRKGEVAFSRLFEEIGDKPSRAELGISDACPTNPQAEVLIYGVIEPRYIAGAFCQTKAIETELRARFPSFVFFSNANFFSARKDYKHWKV